MIDGGPGKAWDFSSVHSLIHQLYDEEERAKSNHDGHHVNSFHTKAAEGSKTKKHVATLSAPVSLGLGNFDSIWTFLGNTGSSNPPRLEINPDTPIQSIERSDYEEQKDSKAVRWRDEVDGADLADDDDDGGGTDGLGNQSVLTKQQRKKANRKKRRQAQADGLDEPKKAQVSSGNESTDDARESKSQKRREIIYRTLYSPSSLQANTKSAVEVLKRIEKPLDEKWPVARPYLLNGFTKAISEPPQTSFMTTASRKAKLVEMLMNRFPNERPYLQKLGAHAQTNGETIGSDGIHVFVDASNIMIGFHDAVRARLSVPSEARFPRQPFSFHSFSMILTRGRPTSKLVLVGSDNPPAYDEARMLGYSVNILARVQKPKELTARQRQYLSASDGLAAGAGGNGAMSAGSGSESYARRTRSHSTGGPSREQAVDEIIQMKMGQSLLDACTCSSSPSTMVLASGDAAEAEFSEGFLKVVEYALSLGWKVEVVSFRDNTSNLYRRRDFRGTWGDQFRLIELDDFVDYIWWREGNS